MERSLTHCKAAHCETETGTGMRCRCSQRLRCRCSSPFALPHNRGCPTRSVPTLRSASARLGRSSVRPLAVCVFVCLCAVRLTRVGFLRPVRARSEGDGSAQLCDGLCPDRHGNRGGGKRIGAARRRGLLHHHATCNGHVSRGMQPAMAANTAGLTPVQKGWAVVGNGESQRSCLALPHS